MKSPRRIGAMRSLHSASNDDSHMSSRDCLAHAAVIAFDERERMTVSFPRPWDWVWLVADTALTEIAAGWSQESGTRRVQNLGPTPRTRRLRYCGCDGKEPGRDGSGLTQGVIEASFALLGSVCPAAMPGRSSRLAADRSSWLVFPFCFFRSLPATLSRYMRCVQTASTGN